MKTILLTTALLMSFSCFSQQKDYLIKHSGDTIWGKIKLKNKIFIISGNESNIVNADKVKKIVCGNYKGTTVLHCTLQLYTENLTELEMGWTNLSSVDTVLVLEEVYTTPKINLYYVTDNIKRQYYFYQTPQDSLPVQLVVRYHLGGGLTAYNNDKPANRGELSAVHIEEDKGYVNQLRAIMIDCNKIPDVMWEILSYRIYSLKKLIKKYNKCR
jgi:hypothetical protein